MNDIRMTCKIILNYIAFEAFISPFSISFVVRKLLYVVANDFLLLGCSDFCTFVLNIFKLAINLSYYS